MFFDLLNRGKRWTTGLLSGLALTSLTLTVQADYKDDIGYTALVNALGAGTPNGSGVKVTQVEASENTTETGGRKTYYYLPTSSFYTGVTFTNNTSPFFDSGLSGHADMVGNLIYGDSSMGNGISEVTTSYAGYWLGSGSLWPSYSNPPIHPDTTPPIQEQNDVQNHSWVGSGTTPQEANIILNRLDFAIERDDFVAVVGVNNGVGLDAPLLSAAYNVISVGVTSGNHSSTPTSAIQRPHIVAPANTTSEATAIVSSAATLLIQQARDNGSANGERSETIKAIMLAGATKTEPQLANWSRADTMPLDSVYGAGELNVFNNYHIMEAGEQTASASPSALVAATGWDYNNISASQTVSYYFNLATDSDVSIALTWNALYSGTDYNDLQLTLANLNLSFYVVGSDGHLTLIQQSISSTENLEYIWAMGLASGSYVIEVESLPGNSSTDYALAWQTSAVPEPSTIGLIIIGSIFALTFFRRRTVRA